MAEKIPFTKMSGAGNDFVVIDNLDRSLKADHPALARALCSRPFGIGADGLLVLEPSDSADFFMRYYNADGSYGGMCGNGGRCAARFAALHGISGSSVRFEALGFVYRATVGERSVTLSMKPPRDIRPEMRIDAEGTKISLSFVNTGAPHAVVLVEDVGSIDVAKTGSLIRRDRAFAPEGTNADFIQLLGGNVVAMRTFERGVEAETLACGTGAVASAVIAFLRHDQKPPIRIRCRSGEDLLVSFTGSGSAITDVTLEGSAHLLFTGEVLYDTTLRKISSLRAPINQESSLPR